MMRYVGRKTRYAYLGIMEWNGEEPVFVGISKLDLDAQDKVTAVVNTIMYGDGVVGGEAFFVPNQQNPADCNGKQPCYDLHVGIW